MGSAVSSEQIIEAIFEAIRTLNSQAPPNQRLTESVDLALVGKSGHLDSLQFVNFVVTLEQVITSRLGVDIILTESEVLANQERIFATVHSLADYIHQRIRDRQP